MISLFTKLMIPKETASASAAESSNSHKSFVMTPENFKLELHNDPVFGTFFSKSTNPNESNSYLV